MPIPSFVLEVESKSSLLNSFEWSQLQNKKRIFIKFKKNNINVSFHNMDGNKLCILGNPIIDNEIDNNKFAKIFFKHGNEKWLKNINGEFIIFYIPKSKKYIEVINSRFSSPMVWYYFIKKKIIISLSFSDNLVRIKKLKEFK